jgi:hypothetical protein
VLEGLLDPAELFDLRLRRLDRAARICLGQLGSAAELA